MKGLKITRGLGVALFAIATVGLAGCGEEPQQGTQAERKVDTRSWEGAQAKFTAGEWKAGDRASWERQLKQRSERQNEYVRIR